MSVFKKGRTIKSRSINTLLNTAAGFAAKIINIVAGLIMRTVFIRTLGIEYAGVSTLFTDILTALSFAELGIGSAITFALYKPLADGDDRRVAALMNFYKKAYRIVAGVVLGVGLAIVPLLKYIVKDVPDIKESITLIYILYVINSAVSYLLIYKSTLLTAKQEQRYVSLVQIGISIARVVIESLILIVFRQFLLYLIVGIFLTRFQNWLTSRLASERYSRLDDYSDEQLPKSERKKLMKDVGALMMYKVSNSMINGCDSVVISSMLGAGWVALVGNYTMVTYRVQTVINQFFNAANPSIGNLAAATNEERQYKTFRVLQFTSFWMSCFCSTCFIVLLSPFVDIWFGGTLVLPMYVVVSLTLYFYLDSMIHCVTSFRNSNGLFVQGKYRPVIMAIINIGLSVLLAVQWGKGNPAMGVFGVKIASSIAQIVTIQWFDPWLIYSKVFGVSLKKYFRSAGVYFAITAACCAATYYLGELIPVSNRYVLFLLKGILCCIIPNGTVYLIYRRSEEYRSFIETMKNIVRKKKKKAAAVQAE